MEQHELRLNGVTKRFPGVLADDHVDFELKHGEIHALLGENGAGKTTLMNMVYGLYQPDEGEIYVRGKKAEIKSPLDAIKLRIGMVHQHFVLVQSQTVVENITLGIKSSREPFVDFKSAKEEIQHLSTKYGLKVNPTAKIWQLSAGEQQRVEILKALYREAEILILDEPTSVLTPQETEQLFLTLRTMADSGKSIVFISHKLPEVMSLSDRVTVLRQGKVVSTSDVKQTSESDLARMMVGRDVLFRINKAPVEKGETALGVLDLWAYGDMGVWALKGISFDVHKGEILGIAGVAGNGQRELAEVLTGLRRASKGKVILDGQDITNKSTGKILGLGVGHVPENRTDSGTIGDFTVAENLIVKSYSSSPFSNRLTLNFGAIQKYCEDLISEYDVKASSPSTPARYLSGGNLQRLILARELSRKCKLLIVSEPTRGLDVGATEYIRLKLLEQREEGVATLLISSDLGEILTMSDRIAVIYDGKIVGVLPGEAAEVGEIGMLMAGSKEN
jgi:simple sugar transport system ATP-binding protein